MTLERADGILWSGPRFWAATAGAFLLIAVACQGTVSLATPLPPSSPTASIGPTATSPQSNAADETYHQLVQQTIDGIGQVTRVLSDVGIYLSGSPEEASQTEEIVDAAKGTFETFRDQLAAETPPPKYEGLHRDLLNALSLYAQAATSLLPDDQTQQADPLRFQELMLQGGNNTHAVITAFQET